MFLYDLNLSNIMVNNILKIKTRDFNYRELWKDGIYIPYETLELKGDVSKVDKNGVIFSKCGWEINNEYDQKIKYDGLQFVPMSFFVDLYCNIMKNKKSNKYENSIISISTLSNSCLNKIIWTVVFILTHELTDYVINDSSFNMFKNKKIDAYGGRRFTMGEIKQAKEWCNDYYCILINEYVDYKLKKQEYGGFISFNEYNKIILLQLNNFK